MPYESQTIDMLCRESVKSWTIFPRRFANASTHSTLNCISRCALIAFIGGRTRSLYTISSDDHFDNAPDIRVRGLLLMIADLRQISERKKKD